MATKIRLQRHGKKGKPFFHIVVADSRSKRDGRFIEKLGTYDPNFNPAIIELNFDSTVSWIGKGAQPTDTARAIISYKGVMMYDHLMRGLAKGALTEEQVKAKFEKWLEDKDNKIQGKKDNLQQVADKDAQARHAAEVVINTKKAADLAAKNAPVVEETEEEVIVEAAAEEAPAEEATEEKAAE